MFHQMRWIEAACVYSDKSINKIQQHQHTFILGTTNEWNRNWQFGELMCVLYILHMHAPIHILSEPFLHYSQYEFRFGLQHWVYRCMIVCLSASERMHASVGIGEPYLHYCCCIDIQIQVQYMQCIVCDPHVSTHSPYNSKQTKYIFSN